MPATFKYSQLFFGSSFILVLYFFYKILQPFLVTIILALTLVSLFYPNYVELNQKLRERSNLSAALMCVIVTLIIIIPSLVFFLALAQEFNLAYEEFRQELAQGQFGQNLPWQDSRIFQDFWRLLGKYLGIERLNLTSAISSVLDRLAGYLLEHYSSILGGIGVLLFNFFVMIFTMFFFFRDGNRFLREIKTLIPLAPHYEDMLLAKLKDVTYATFFGIFATSICQGILAGIIFFALGVGSPILWGTATAFFSLVPVVGTAAIWLPMGIYLMLAGSIARGVILVVLGATVIGLVDNVLRPMIIEGRTSGMHLLLVFFSLAGGLWFFGLSGLLLGPLVAALFVTFLEIYKVEFREDLETQH